MARACARCCTCIGVLLLVSLVVFLVALFFLPCMPPYVNFPEYKGPAPEPLKADEVLNDVEHLAEGKLRGPAALAVRDGQLYTGLLGGQVVKVDLDNVEDMVTVTRLGHPDCMSELEGEKCGRPMGMQFHTDGKLYLIDAYHGLYRVDVDTGKWEHLAGGDQYIGGQRVRLACDLAVARDGRVFWSDASTEVGPQDMTLELLSAGSGRLLRYDPRTNRTETLIGRVNCATGVTLAPDESYVLVAEAGNDRILKYHLAGSKVGVWDVFAEGLPGVPATIRPGGPSKGGYLVTLAMTHPSFLLWLRRHPTLGRTIMRLSALAESAFASINDLVQNDVSRDVVYMLGNPQLLAPLLDGGAVIALDRNGKIVGGLRGKNLGILSQVESVDDYVYLASPYNPYLGRVNLTNELRQSLFGWNETSSETSSENSVTSQQNLVASSKSSTTPEFFDETDEANETTSREESSIEEPNTSANEDTSQGDEDTTLSNQVDELTEENNSDLQKQIVSIK